MKRRLLRKTSLASSGSGVVHLVVLLLVSGALVNAHEVPHNRKDPPGIPKVKSCLWFSIEQSLDLLTDGQKAFEGTVAFASTPEYEVAREQYASVNFPDRVNPNMVIRVESESDIQAVVRFASQCEYAVSVRSGGHSYLGLSSCDSKESPCIQIDVGHLNHTEVRKDEWQLVAGPGNRLEDLGDLFKETGMWLPTGECAKVGLGGHTQTGGVGLWGRQFGPFASHVDSFRIVLADGSIHQVTTPSDTTSRRNDDLYYAVLGGASGSWGVLTEVTFNPIKAEEYFSAFWQVNFLWNLGGVVNFFRTWSEWAQENRDDQRWSFHFSMSTVGGAANLGFALQIEISWVAPMAEANEYDSSVFHDLLSACTGCRYVGFLNETAPLSSTLKDRYIGSHEGPEIPGARFYEKRWHQTTKIPGPDQIEAIIRQVEAIRPDFTDPHLFISQFSTGVHPGNNKPTIGLPWQDDRIGITIDIFYKDAELAPTYHQMGEDFTKTIVESFGGEDHRMYWGAFDVSDMKTEWPLYFESEEKFETLRRIKACVDPDNLFTHKMAIPLPDNNPECPEEIEEAPSDGEDAVDTDEEVAGPETPASETAQHSFGYTTLVSGMVAVAALMFFYLFKIAKR